MRILTISLRTKWKNITSGCFAENARRSAGSRKVHIVSAAPAGQRLIRDAALSSAVFSPVRDAVSRKP
jgi:hypothetical protein